MEPNSDEVLSADTMFYKIPGAVINRKAVAHLGDQKHFSKFVAILYASSTRPQLYIDKCQDHISKQLSVGVASHGYVLPYSYRRFCQASPTAAKRRFADSARKLISSIGNMKTTIMFEAWPS
eukprot:scaffold491194_cov19-Prasinocladus_malaysianus.AAC.1